MSKNKSVKSNLSMSSPKGSLIAEINNLRKELKDNKQLKKQSAVLSEKPMRDLFSHMNKKSPQQKCPTSLGSTAKERFFKASKEDFTSPSKMKIPGLASIDTQKSIFEGQKKEKSLKNQQKRMQKPIIKQVKQPIEIIISEIWLKEKDRKLKLDIEINKLRKTILKLGPEEITQQLNYIISLVNVSTREYSYRIELLEKNQKADDSDEYLLIKRQQEEIDSLTQKIIDYEDKIKELKDQLKLNAQTQGSLQNINKVNNFEKNDLRTRAETLESIVKELDQKAIQLQEQNKILSSKLFKKEEQLLLINEDINYLRIQTYNYKQQKKQFSDLYENTLCELRECKRTKNLQIQKLQQEKDKWEKECKLRRNQSEEITALEEQKIALMKELSEMRHLCNLKNSELEEKKALNHENQKKVIQMESQIYKIKSEVQTLRNQKEFTEFENEKIKEQFEDLKRYTRKNNSKQKYTLKSIAKIENEQEISQNLNEKTVLKVTEKENIEQIQLTIEQNDDRREVYSRKLKEKQEKLRALQDIHSLIKKHRNEMQI